ncbi:PAAR-like domain-containing protein [Chondromyces apiculatus]|uniref:Uncharacterized protein n=1 Tax=Chondromyces apiculatus DSM 436 TaxID=1192034 RepID=A0A017SZW7_9BACT|nr:PAAR-like domain-containing protein [Chondromyces apiculatus]EYF02508.1 Hypothetical protein CAP_6715 [Chondromyces apiculatus DSM 436]
MADNEGLRVTGEAIVLSTTPDVCRTPPTMAPVPYQILGRFSDGIRHATTVCMTGEAVMTMDSRLTTVYGDEAGVGGGVISGVNKGYCKPVTHSTTVTVEGHHVTYHTSIYEMNCDGPDGVGNTRGRVVFVENVDCVKIGPLGEIEGETSPTPEPETKEEESWWEKGLSAVHTMLDVVGLVPGLGEIADGVNAVIHGVEAAGYAIAGNQAKAAENALMGTLSVAAMLPIGGQAATAGKFAIKAGKEVVEEAGEKVVKEGVEAAAEKLEKEIGEKALKPSGGKAPASGVQVTGAADKVPKPGVSGKGGSKDVPSWARGNRPTVEESGKDFARRLMDEKYGKGGWSDTGPSSEFNQIKKWGDRAFEMPKDK